MIMTKSKVNKRYFCPPKHPQASLLNISGRKTVPQPPQNFAIDRNLREPQSYPYDISDAQDFINIFKSTSRPEIMHFLNFFSFINPPCMLLQYKEEETLNFPLFICVQERKKFLRLLFAVLYT